MIKQIPIKDVILIVIIMILAGYSIFFSNNLNSTLRETKIEINNYNNNIKQLQNKIDSIEIINKTYEFEMNNLITKLKSLDKDLNVIAVKINDIKVETNEKINFVDGYSVYELQKFFTDRYSDSTITRTNSKTGN